MKLLQNIKILIRFRRFLAFLNLDRRDLIPIHNKQVDLLLIRIPVIEQIDRFAGIVITLNNFRNDISFKEGTIHRTIRQGLRIRPPA